MTIILEDPVKVQSPDYFRDLCVFSSFYVTRSETSDGSSTGTLQGKRRDATCTVNLLGVIMEKV